MKKEGVKLILIFVFISLLISLVSSQNYSVNVTNEHPFLLSNGSYIPASQLLVGMQLMTINGKKAIVSSITDVHSDVSFPVFNLEASPFSDFLLPGGVVVHNSDGIKSCVKGGCGGQWCFSGDTLISMANGRQDEIMNIKPGEKVLSWDFKNNKTVIGIVTNISKSFDEAYIINNQIEVSSTHAFWTEEVGWASISGENENWKSVLKVGYHFMYSNGSYLKINSIKPMFESMQMYNLINIQNTSNYFADGVLVHNVGCSDSTLESIANPTPEELNSLFSEIEFLKSLSMDPENLRPGLETGKGQYKDAYLLDPQKFSHFGEISTIEGIIKSQGITNAVIKFVKKCPTSSHLPDTTLDSFLQEISVAKKVNNLF